MARIPTVFRYNFRTGDFIDGSAYGIGATPAQIVRESRRDGHMYVNPLRTGDIPGSIQGGQVELDYGRTTGMRRNDAAAVTAAYWNAPAWRLVSFYVLAPGNARIRLIVYDMATALEGGTLAEFVVQSEASDRMFHVGNQDEFTIPPAWGVRVMADDGAGAAQMLTGNGFIHLFFEAVL